MNPRRSHGRGSGCRRGPVKRVVRGLADVFGVPRGVIVTGFVLGFVCVPQFTLLAGFAAWFWLDHPDLVRRYSDTARGFFKRATDRLRGGISAPPHRGTSSGPGIEPHEAPCPSVDPTTLARRYEKIERRTRTIEAFVASEEFRLNREFRRMERNQALRSSAGDHDG